LSKAPLEDVRMDAETVLAPHVPVSMPVLFVRAGIASLPLSTEQTQMPLERIKEVLDDLRKEDGMDWEAYFESFNIEHSGSLADGISMLLTECGFKCLLKEDNQNLYFVFELPHGFEQHQTA
jgi:hypothetical protein